MIKKSKLILLAISFIFSLQAEAFLFKDDFENDLCGTFPKGWSLSGWFRKNEHREHCRYITNTESVSGEKSLAYDFSQMPIVTKSGPHPHAYTNKKLPPIRDGWVDISFCFKKELGSLTLEIRGEHKNGNGIKVPWWINIGDTVKIKSASASRFDVVVAGNVRPKVWYRLNLKLPTINGGQKEAQIRLDRYLGGGQFELGEFLSVPMGKMILTAPYTHFDFSGYGQSKFFIDDVMCDER